MIKAIRSGNGREYLSNAIKDCLVDNLVQTHLPHPVPRSNAHPKLNRKAIMGRFHNDSCLRSQWRNFSITAVTRNFGIDLLLSFPILAFSTRNASKNPKSKYEKLDLRDRQGTMIFSVYQSKCYKTWNVETKPFAVLRFVNFEEKTSAIPQT